MKCGWRDQEENHLGYLGSAFEYEIMNWPQLGQILAIVVMGDRFKFCVNAKNWYKIAEWHIYIFIIAKRGDGDTGGIG